MKAFVLAAGKGERLKPITNTIPKCLVPINGKPLLEIWLEAFRSCHIHEVLINLCYHADKVKAFLAQRDWGIKITTFFEKELLGTAATIRMNKDFVRFENDFLIVYADNLTSLDLNEIISFHRAKQSGLTMGLFHADKPQEAGIAELDSMGKIISFQEKPSRPASRLANAGIYVSGQELFDYIPNKRYTDFGFDVLPRLVGKMYGYIIKDFYIDIGTNKSYKKACTKWRQRVT